MNYTIVIGFIVKLAFMAEMTIAQETVESLMKKTVDFDAPVIGAEEVLSMLKQIQQMVPKKESAIQFDLENLISFSVMKPEKCTTKFDEQRNWCREPNNVSSPNKDKLWGQNIMAYFTYYKVKSFEYCIGELKKNIENVSQDDLKKLQKISNFIKPDGLKSLDELDHLTVFAIFDGVTKYLKESDESFDKDMQKSKTREKAHERYEKDLPVVCRRVMKNIKPIQFVGKARYEEDFPKEQFDNKFLAQWLMNCRICSHISNTEIDEFDSFYFGDKGIPVEKLPFWKRVATGGYYGSSGGGGGGPSMSSMASASVM